MRSHRIRRPAPCEVDSEPLPRSVAVRQGLAISRTAGRRELTSIFGAATMGPMARSPSTPAGDADRPLDHAERHGRAWVECPPGQPADDRTALGRTSTRGRTAAATPARRRPDPVLHTAIETLPIDRRISARESGIGGPWDALDRFIGALQAGRQVPDQYRTALSAVCGCTGARLAFLYSDQLDRVMEIVGDLAPAPQWCCDFWRKVVTDLPRGGLWESPEPGSPNAPAGLGGPFAAAMLPVETPRPAWLVAVSFEGERPFRHSDLRVLRVIWRLQVGHNRHALVYDNLKETLFGIVRCLSTAIDAKDPYTCGHSERVARIAVRLGEELKLTRGEISDLYLAGLLHDVGKIGIRDEVLCKAGPLTAEEFDHIKEHPVIGRADHLERLPARLPPPRRAWPPRAVRRQGVPRRPRRRRDPAMARILAVADACDAMMSARRYRPEFSRARIEVIFREGAGTQWDPSIVEAFFACRHDLYTVYQRGLGQSVYVAVERAAAGDGSRNAPPKTNPSGL